MQIGRRRSPASATSRCSRRACGGSTHPTGSSRSSLPRRRAGRSRRSCLPRSSAAARSARALPAGRRAASRCALALAEVPEDAAVVLVHDAARPLLEEDVIERVLTALNEGWDGAVPALADRRHGEAGRRRRASSRRSSATSCVAVQTPQAFVASVLRDALLTARSAAARPTVPLRRGARRARKRRRRAIRS